MPTQYQIPLERTANAPIPEGIHPFRITGGSEEEGPKGPYWSFTVVCLTPGEEGKTTRLMVSLTPQARWRAELFLDAIGAPATGVATIEKFLNRTFRGQVRHETYQGRPQAKIEEMFPYAETKSGPAPSPSASGVKVKRVGADPVPAEPVVEPLVDTGKGLPADASSDEEEPPF